MQIYDNNYRFTQEQQESKSIEDQSRFPLYLFLFSLKKKKKDAVSITARNEFRMINTKRFLAFTDLKEFRLPVDHRKNTFFWVFYLGTDKKLEHDSYLLFKSSFHIGLVFFI